MNETLEIDGMDPEADKSSVLKALRLLSHVAQSFEPVMLADLSRAVRLPKPTSYRLATMLERAGYMRKDPLTLRYSIGPRFEDIALSGLRNGSAGMGRRALMDVLAKRAGARVNFVVMRGSELLNITWVESTSAIRVDIHPDLQVPIQCSASGKLLLAYAKEEVRQRFLRTAPFRASTPASITTVQGLKQEFARIRTRDYSEDKEELFQGVNCLAVPVRNTAGDVVAGLALMAPVAVLPLAQAKRFLPDLRACAEAIAADMDMSASKNDAARRQARLKAKPTRKAHE
jgi:DNA-binding IclR family transcriptional regulator